jgi:hypothetical protein
MASNAANTRSLAVGAFAQSDGTGCKFPFHVLLFMPRE